MIQIHHEKLDGSTSAGTLALNTRKFEGILGNVIIEPASESTIYTVQLINAFSAVVYERTSEEGSMSEELRLPVSGIYTVNIIEATNDEAFKILLVIQTL